MDIYETLTEEVKMFNILASPIEIHFQTIIYL